LRILLEQVQISNLSQVTIKIKIICLAQLFALLNYLPCSIFCEYCFVVGCVFSLIEKKNRKNQQEKASLVLTCKYYLLCVKGFITVFFASIICTSKSNTGE